MSLRIWARMLAAGVLVNCIGSLTIAAGVQGSLRDECDYGVALALEGRLGAADSVFTSLLSHAPGDARALTNLGNLHLLRGEREVALAFYRLAASADSADAGILLNRATTHFLMSEDSLARLDATKAVILAGGTKPAESLLSLKRRGAHDERAKAADMSAPLMFPMKRSSPGQRTAVSRADLQALMSASDENTASRAASPRHTDETGGVSSSRQPAASGPKSYESNAAAVLYWKR